MWFLGRSTSYIVPSNCLQGCNTFNNYYTESWVLDIVYVYVQYFPDDVTPYHGSMQDGRPGCPNSTSPGAAHQASQFVQRPSFSSRVDAGPVFKIVDVFCRATV